jgi:hypothetical protein
MSSATPTVPPTRILRKSIYRTAANLGARIDQGRDLPKSIKRCPGFIAEFYKYIIWPKRQTYDAPSFEPVELEQVSLEGLQQVPKTLTIQGSEGMDLFGIGKYDGGNWLLLFDGNDKKPSDPTVYSVDHEIPEESLENMGRLSDFLSMLVVHDE